MELNWSTYLLEIVNFLILVWILKRFLYRPVLEVISRRRQAVEQTIADADARRAEAETLKAQFENRLADWETEKQAARQELQGELDAQRRRRVDDLETELAAARERSKVRDARRLDAAAEAREREALTLAARFSSRLLGRLADPSLEARLIELALKDLRALPPDRHDRLRDALRAVPSVRVLSAYSLADTEIAAIRAAVSDLAGQPVECGFEQDLHLVAGVRIIAGPWVLKANLQDELDAFASIGRDGRQA
jgi:F-type H+-transporting ATPase subunit b